MPTRLRSLAISRTHNCKTVEERAYRWPLDPARVLMIRRSRLVLPGTFGPVQFVFWYAVLR
jgi:hypothetical protein